VIGLINPSPARPTCSRSTPPLSGARRRSRPRLCGRRDGSEIRRPAQTRCGATEDVAAQIGSIQSATPTPRGHRAVSSIIDDMSEMP